MHAQLDFSADFKVGEQEHVQCMADDALRRILDRDDAEICVARLHLLEHAIDPRQADSVDRVSEMAMDGLLREGPLGTEIGDL